MDDAPDGTVQQVLRDQLQEERARLREQLARLEAMPAARLCINCASRRR